MELIQRVSAIVAAVVSSVVMPSFRSLRPEDIHAKKTPGDPDDLVTIVDEAAERYLIDALRELIPGAARDVLDRLRGAYEPRPSTGSAATEYAAILRGEKDFVIYNRLLPWDHAPGALAITEAGGAALHLSGESYTPLSPKVTIFAASVELAETIRVRLTETTSTEE